LLPNASPPAGPWGSDGLWTTATARPRRDDDPLTPSAPRLGLRHDAKAGRPTAQPQQTPQLLDAAVSVLLAVGLVPLLLALDGPAALEEVAVAEYSSCSLTSCRKLPSTPCS
jgi:hypothetical protein